MALYHLDYKPRLMGANWFKVTTDDYIRHVYVNNYNANKDVVCNGVQGYENPCPVDHGTMVSPQFLTLLLVLFSVKLLGKIVT